MSQHQMEGMNFDAQCNDKEELYIQPCHHWGIDI